jgi:hypothetical protein
VAAEAAGVIIAQGGRFGSGGRRQPMIFSADETTDLGADSATPVSNDYNTKTSTFKARVRWVQIDLGADAEDADHLISAEERHRNCVGDPVTPPASLRRRLLTCCG